MKIIFSVLFIAVSFFSIAQAPELVIPKGHAAEVSVLAISHDDKLLASGSNDKTVILWDYATGKELKTFNGYPNWITSIGISSDNKKLVSGSFEELRVNDLSQSGKEIFKQKAHQYDITAIAFSADGNLLATTSRLKKAEPNGRNIELIIWNLASMTKVKRILFKGETATEIRFENNNQILFIGANKIYTININSASVIKAQVIIDEGQYGSYLLSPDGKWIATADYDNTEVGFSKVGAIVKIFDRETLTKVKVFNATQEQIRIIKFSSDSKYIAAGAKNSINVYSLQSMSQVAKSEDKMEWPTSLLFTTDNNYVIAGDKDKIIRTWNIDNGKLQKKLGAVAKGVEHITLSPNGQSLAVTNSNGGIQVLDLTQGVVTNQYQNVTLPVNVQYTSDGKYLVRSSYGENIELWDAVTGEKQSEITGSISTSQYAVFPDKDLIVSSQGWDSKEIFVRSLMSGSVKNKFSLPEKASALTFAPDGLSVYVGLFAGNKTIRIDIETGRVLQTFYHPGEIPKGWSAIPIAIKKIIVTKNGSEIITADQYSNIRWWNVATGKELGENHIDKQFNAMVVLPGEKKLFACGGEAVFPKPNISLIDADTKKEIQQLAAHTNSPNSLALSANAKYLFSGSFDRTVKIWNVADGKLLATMVFFGEKDWVIVDEAGRFDGTQTGMQKMYYSKGLDVLPLESGYEQFYTPNLLQRILNNEKFTPPVVDINNIKAAPIVKIFVEEQQRNLSVGDDISTYKTDKELVTIKVKADCPEDAVTEIRLYQNGKLVQTTRNLTVEDENKGEKTMTKTFSVTLNAGANNFKAVAINSQRTESLPAELIADYKPLVIPVKTKENDIQLYLFVVGVNTYKNPKYTLNYAKADAAAFTEAITTGSQSLFGKINTTVLNDAEATKEGIAAAFEKIKVAANPQDLFIFYYAGHGVVNDKKEFFLVPYDVIQLYGNDGALAQKGFSAAALQQMSKEIKAQKQLFILDACQSAGALEVVAGSRGAAEEKAIAQLARATGTQWLTASGSEQFASEFSQLGHGSFTWCLLQAFKGDANAGDKKLTVKQLDAYLQTKVPEITQKYKGTPQYPASYSYGNDFPIIIIK